MEIQCPQCSSKAFKRNGFTRHGKQNHRCLDCGRQFSTEPDTHYVLEVLPQSSAESNASFSVYNQVSEYVQGHSQGMQSPSI